MTSIDLSEAVITEGKEGMKTEANALPNSLFSGAKSLTKAVLPKGTVSIGRNCFAGCSDLSDITIPEAVTTIGANAFEGCSSLSFGYMKTDYNVRCYYRDGKWGEIEVCSDEYLKLHMAATCLHYGQEAFEGLKAYRCPDGKVRVFRVDENAARLQSTCRGLVMPEISTELFIEMVKKVGNVCG